MRKGWAAAAVVAVLLAPVGARAQDIGPSQPKVRWALDGSITGVAALGTVLVSFMRVDTSARWQRAILPFDHGLEGRASASAARTSDILAAVNVVTPLGLMLGQTGMNEAYGKRTLLYGETVMIGLFLNGLTKYLVGRPRPYTYSQDANVLEHAKGEGQDTHLSFYSGHASTTFAAGVAGAYLFAQGTTDKHARAAVWGFELLLAGATASLRTRAGKHFYSDVIVGAIVGAGIGYAVPRLHGGTPPTLATAEWVAIGVAPVAGAVLAQLLPAKADLAIPLHHAAVLPWVAPSGGGLMLARVF